MTDPRGRGGGLLERAWIRVLVAAWVVAVVTIYIRLLAGSVLVMTGLLPEH